METEKIDASMDIPKPEVEGTENEGKQSEKLVSMEKRVEVCIKELHSDTSFGEFEFCFNALCFIFRRFRRNPGR